MTAAKPDFKKILQDSLSSDASIRVPAETQLRQGMETNFVSFVFFV
jgi:hypothetical protein